MVQAALFITALLSLLFGMVIFLNNPKSTLFRLYLLLSISSALWMSVNAVVVGQPIHPSPQAMLHFAQFITPFALATSLSFYLFLRYFNKHKLGRLELLATLLSVSVSLFSFSEINVYLTDTQEIALGPLYPIYLLTLLLNLGLVLYSLYSKRVTTARERLQLQYIRFGTFGTIIPALAFGSILPLFSDSSLSNIGPLFSIAFLSFAGVAIVRHGLFDIRLIVARSLGYILSLAILATVYGFLVFSVTNLVFNVDISYGVQAFLSLSTAAFGLGFQPFRKKFDSVTRRVFYRDAYDPEIFLADVNRAVITNVDIQPLLNQVGSIIEKFMKPEFVTFDIRETSYIDRRMVGNTSESYNPVKIKTIESLVSEEEYPVISLTDAQDTYPALYKVMRNQDIYVIAKLSPTAQYIGPGYGLLLVGPKKSGNQYNAQDTNILRIVAGELSIAVQNALRFEEIEKFNVTLQEKVDDATHKLRKTNEKLKAMDETKDEFISMASHQLRTPLTSVKGYVSMVLEGDAGKLNDMQRKLLEQSFASSQRMVYLIADLLNLSRLRTGKFVIEAKPTNLADVIESEVEQLKVSAAGRNLTLEYKKPDKFPELMLDDTKIRQVIMNFADNAIYYTPSGGKIDIQLKETKDSVEFTVNDNGIGIPVAEQHHLFNKFYRAKNAQKARPDGTGLGLFMAKKVIIAQGGAIVFRSVENKGSTFGFTFSKHKLKVPEHLRTDTTKA